MDISGRRNDVIYGQVLKLYC